MTHSKKIGWWKDELILILGFAPEGTLKYDRQKQLEKLISKVESKTEQRVKAENKNKIIGIIEEFKRELNKYEISSSGIDDDNEMLNDLIKTSRNFISDILKLLE